MDVKKEVHFLINPEWDVSSRASSAQGCTLQMQNWAAEKFRK